MTAAAATALPDGRAILLDAIAKSTRPRSLLTVSQWADGNRILTSKASKLEGPWRTDRTPFLREPMDCLSIQSPIQKVVLKFPTQIGKSETGFNWVGYVMAHAPAPMLYSVPTLEVRKRIVRQRVDPMIASTRVLSALFDVKRRRDGANTEEMKDYPGGILILGGANSPASLASMPIKYAINDELDRFPWEVGKGDKAEGDPLGLIRERMSSYTSRAKELDISTPLMKGSSAIDHEFETTDQRYYHVPCPHCDALLVLRWPQLHYNRDCTEARYVCEHCGAEIEEYYKTEMLREGRWIPSVPDFKLPWRGYTLNALYAPLGLGDNWVKLARMWREANADATKVKLKRFINTKLAESYEDRSRDVKAKTLKDRAEPYRLREIPRGCLILTLGVDVQDDRIACQIVGWGRNDSCWIIDWLEIPGDPVRMLAAARNPALLQDDPQRRHAGYYDYVLRPIVNQFGKTMRIEATLIDSGHHTHDVYMYTREQKTLPHLMAGKGASRPGRVIVGRPELQDINWRGRVIKSGAKLWMVGTDTAKHALYARLTGDTKMLADTSSDENAPPPALSIHFSQDLPDEYYDGLLSEVFDPEKNKWTKRRGRKNEPLDTWVYACAAAQHPEVRVHAKRSTDWAKLEAMLEPETPEQKTALVVPPPEPKPAASAPLRIKQADDPWLR